MFWMNFEIFMFSPQVIFIYEKGETCIFPKTKFLIFRTFEHNPRKFWVHIYHFYINSQLFSACSLPQQSMPKSQFMFERVKWGSKCLKSTCSWKKNLSIHWKNCPLRIVLQNRAKILLKFSDLCLMCTSELCLLPFDTLLWFSHFTHAFLIGSSDFQIFSKILICNARDDDLVYIWDIFIWNTVYYKTWYIWGQKSKWDLLLFCDYNWINFNIWFLNFT